MTVVVLGIDALDPDLVDPAAHPNLVLDDYSAIDTFVSHTGEPSTHELWPTIITGLSPEDHGLKLEEDGVAWGNPLLDAGGRIADHLLPDAVQTKLGAWLLTRTSADAFRTPATYYPKNNISTIFDGRESLAIGVPNYVVDTSVEDREHQLRRSLGDLFERDPNATGGHSSTDPDTFYEQCLEMSMVRIARIRRALRGGRYELVFGYTSGLDLIGHVTYDRPSLQRAAYDEIDDFVGELRDDLDGQDTLFLISDHGLQDGVHTEEALVAATDPTHVSTISDLADFRQQVETELEEHDHKPDPTQKGTRDATRSEVDEGRVKDQLEDLGYI